MPRNNLSEQIKWLLSAKPFIPPAAPLAGYDPEAPPSSSLLPETPLLHVEPASHDAPLAASARPITHPTPPSSLPETRPDITGRIPSGANTAADMARLRGPPGSGKPRLRVAEIPLYDTPSTSATKPRKHISSEDTRQPSSSTPSYRTPATGKRPIEDIEVDAIDLTGDNEIFVPSTPRRVRLGKKRKSDEFEEDLRRQKSPRAIKCVPPASPRDLDVDEFAHIDDLMAAPPLSPPPPYSSAMRDNDNQTYGKHQEGEYDDDLGITIPESYEDEVMIDTEPQVFETNRKRKSLSRVPSEISDPPRKLGRQAQHPSPIKSAQFTPRDVPSNSGRPRSTPVQKVRQAVLDSEDEDFGDLEDLESEPPSPFEAPKPQSRMVGASSAQVSRPNATRSEQISRPNSTTRPEQMAASLPIRSPAKSSHGLGSQQFRYESPSSPTRSRQSPKMRMSPKKSHSTHTPGPVLPPSSEFSKEKRDLMRQAVERFLRAEGHRLEMHLKGACEDWDQVRVEYSRHLEEFGYAQPSETEKVQQSLSKKKAMEELVGLALEHEKLSRQREEARKKIDDDLIRGLIPVDGAMVFKITKTMEGVEAQIYSQLETSGMNKYLENPGGIDNDVDDVVIRSTQAAPASRAKKVSASPAPNHIPQTQYIKQTQISVREVWTPSREIKFAKTPAVDSRSVLSSKPNIEQIRHGPFVGNSNSKLKEIPHRVPETPPTLRVHSKPARARDSSGYDSFHTPEDYPGPEDFPDAEDFPDDFEEEENLFSNHMGTPPRHQHEDENFCEDDDDDFLDDLANIENQPPGGPGFDWKGEKVSTLPRNQSKTIKNSTHETSKNPARQKKDHSSLKKLRFGDPGFNFPWSQDVIAVMKHFKMGGFRPGQLEAVNTTLNGEHCFVLMPTGGGKSLCYQLPSVIRSGKSRGVTLVISPLLSLMEDQVTASKDRFGIQAFLLNSETTAEQKALIMGGLRDGQPQDFVQMLFITPEQIDRNGGLMAIFKGLHSRNQLARIVIDEAHCVSQWGHDFRPTYKTLGESLRQFTGVPIIALTATATELVQKDVIETLGIHRCRKISQSFNRPNLVYEVRQKGKGFLKDIAELIKSKYTGKSGIVYCLSRDKCEQVAKELSELGIPSHHYHAKMEPAEKKEVQTKWQQNKYLVIVATIAFGMGIDKPDVRFVIHHTLPKSLEGYYQETGRAGRDGKLSGCYLYFMFADSRILRTMIDKGEGDRMQKERQHMMLERMILYCDNKSDCRRVQVLSYFSEKFDREQCEGKCDNCRSDATFEDKDFTDYAAAVVKLVEKAGDGKVTLIQCVDAFRGMSKSKLKDLELEEFGAGKDLDRGVAERLFHRLIDANALCEYAVYGKSKFAVNYIKLGPRSRDYANGRKPFKMKVVVGSGKSGPVTKKKRSAAEYPSTNISSPVRAPRNRNIRDFEYQEDAAPRQRRTERRNQYESDQFVVPDDEDYEDDFEPIRVAKPLASSRSKTLGRPITVDERISALDETQRGILNQFMSRAKSLCQKILVDRQLRNQPFSDTLLREMGLDLPTSEEEMLEIPGINAEMVKRYGKRFLRLVEEFRPFYGPDIPPPRKRAPGRRIVEEDDDEAEEDERPLDPNHRHVNVIDISSDDEAQEDVESTYSDDDEEDDDNLQTSHHFTQAAADPRVEEFNRRASQLEADAAHARGQSAPAPRRSPQGLPKRRDLPFKKRGGSKRKSAGGSAKGYAGVKKAAPKKATNARASGSFGATRKPSGGGGRGGAGGGAGNAWKSIMAMPT